MLLNTGFTEIQISLLSKTIKKITTHLKIHKKDLHSQRGLINMVSLRKKLIKYNKKTLGTQK